jgi:HD-like signal output (HDOD) protein
VSPVSSPPFVPRSTPEDVVRRLTHLPSAPRVLPKLKRLLSDTNSSLHEVVNLIRLDPGIAARVLQIGNSAYFSHGLRCYTVDEAVHRVGYNQVYELVSNAVAAEVLVRPLVSYSIGPDELWQNSVACAVAAERLADRIGVERAIAYTVGLLHQVGLVAIDEWLQRVAPAVRFEPGSPPLDTIDQERQLLGFHNAEAGAALLRLWDFPSVMAEPVRWQYLPSATISHGQLASLLAVAKWISKSALSQQPPPSPDAALLRRCGLSSSQLRTEVTHVRSRLSEISSLLADNDERHILTFPGGTRVVATVRRHASCVDHTLADLHST